MKKIVLSILILAITVLATAQNKSEVSVYLGAGSSSLKYDLDESGDVSSKVGPLFGVGYTYKLTSQWGIVSGLEVATYKTEVSSQELKAQYITQDNYGNDLEWRLRLQNLKENHSATYLNIPIMAQFTPGDNSKFYTNIGVKVGIPISGKYEASHTKLIASGYYPETNVVYPDIDFRGFGEFNGSTTKGDLDFGIAFSLAAECGLKWKLSNSMNLYTGGYIDYGLNSIIKDNGEKNIIPYKKDDPTNFEYNSLMSNSLIIDKVTPLAFGLKVRLGFSL